MKINYEESHPQNRIINLNSLSAHLEEISGVCEVVSHIELLPRLIDKVKELKIREMETLTKKETTIRPEQLIIVVDTVLALAKKCNWHIGIYNGNIFQYNGEYWCQVEQKKIQRFLGKVAEQMGVYKYKAKYFVFQENLYKQFVSSVYHLEFHKKDKSVLINLNNGTFEFSAKGFHHKSFDPKDFLRYQLNFSYNPESQAPKFQAFLDEVLPDKNSQRILAEYIGYIFVPTSALKLEKILLLYGSGANGKSVFFDIVNALIGKENIVNFSLQSLTDFNSYQRAKIENKLLNYVSELSGNLESSIFKQLVSGEPVEARLPYKEPVIIENYAKLMFNCNELPRNFEHTPAYIRRFLIIPFIVTIPQEKQDKNLSQKIIATELSGVFNWVLEGLTRLLSQKGFTESTLVNEAIEQYEKMGDSVKLFIEDTNCIKCLSSYILLKEIYKEYRSFCIEDGYKPLSKIKFSKRLQNMNILVEKKNVGNVVYLTKELTPF